METRRRPRPMHDRFTFRLSTPHRAVLEAAAAALDVSLAEYIRSVALQDARKRIAGERGQTQEAR